LSLYSHEFEDAILMELFDTHIHLYAEEFDSDRTALIAQATESGVTKFYMPNIDSTSIQAMMKVETDFPGRCFSMMGLHPCSVKANWNDEIKIVEEWLSKRKFAAVGEMGIDLYWDKTFIAEQKNIFRKQIELANHYRLPVVIHTRDSFDVAYELLKEIKKEEPCGIFHCFTGSRDDAKKVIDMGFYIGIGGVLTFKNAGLDETISDIDINNIVLETDAPYLAPAPFRGKRNIPEYIVKVASRLAEIKNLSVDQVGRITSANALKIFESNI
jgi:TatD DNase family protein